jgi:hypothetical protein
MKRLAFVALLALNACQSQEDYDRVSVEQAIKSMIYVKDSRGICYAFFYPGHRDGGFTTVPCDKAFPTEVANNATR